MSSQIRTSENLLRSEILIKRCVQVLIIDAQTTTHEDRCEFIRLILDYDNIITFNGMAQGRLIYNIFLISFYHIISLFNRIDNTNQQFAQYADGAACESILNTTFRT
ncbi:hypothetical protein RirG_074260 [Rhizophagus irregularis DAOM 197198w]|uniref:Uncharacterized protein n=1 Tax=Rhizophagus irregularis (strain DAOM 197198w) TaxID=1432141 RepID=A0A015JX29_RHIIW|nr:hypothetical protein RirG_074260 [Rhizophagus irregularis DAOM 197198w]